MDKKKIVLYATSAVLFGIFLFFLFYNNRLISNKSLGASVDNIQKETDNPAVNSAKKFIEDNIEVYDGYTELTVEYLKKVGYMTGEEIYEKTNSPFKDEVRIALEISNGKVVDAYLKNIYFTDVYSCTDVCYFNQDNYLVLDGTLYRIIKMDQDNNIYATQNINKTVLGKDIEEKFKEYNNNFKDSIVKNVTSVTYNDVKNSTIIEKNDNIVVNTSEGYKDYNVDTEELEKIEDEKAYNVLPVLVIKNDLLYEGGTGTQLDPFLIGE